MILSVQILIWNTSRINVGHLRILVICSLCGIRFWLTKPTISRFILNRISKRLTVAISMLYNPLISWLVDLLMLLKSLIMHNSVLQTSSIMWMVLPWTYPQVGRVNIIQVPLFTQKIISKPTLLKMIFIPKNKRAFKWSGRHFRSCTLEQQNASRDNARHAKWCRWLVLDSL
jgi:hypothetical protein